MTAPAEVLRRLYSLVGSVVSECRFRRYVSSTIRGSPLPAHHARRDNAKGTESVSGTPFKRAPRIYFYDSPLSLSASERGCTTRGATAYAAEGGSLNTLVAIAQNVIESGWEQGVAESLRHCRGMMRVYFQPCRCSDSPDWIRTWRRKDEVDRYGGDRCGSR
jgi:hypothetical protein